MKNHRVKTSIRSIRGYAFEVTAYLNREIVGVYRFKRNSYREPRFGDAVVVTSYMGSERPKNGIPRALLKKAVRTLEQLAVSRRSPIEHQIYLNGDMSRARLPELVLGEGYTKVKRDFYVRRYEP